MGKLTDELRNLQSMGHQIDMATDDAKAYGGGWLLVDPQGIEKRVQPPEVVAWAAREMEKRESDGKE